jgi:hypothetical protein
LEGDDLMLSLLCLLLFSFLLIDSYKQYGITLIPLQTTL